MTIDEFFAKYNGITTDFDGQFGPQCVDLYRRYVADVLGCPQSPGVNGAKDIWTTYLTQYFDKFYNTLTAVPMKGDIIIWNQNVGYGKGHVAIYSTGNVMSFESFDQNWGIVPCHFQKHDYANIYGWIRFKSTTDYKTLYEQAISKLNQIKTIVS